MIFRLTEELIFPDPHLAEPSGLLAIGGDLSPERLLLAYSQGIFPWFSPGEEIIWYATHPRFVLFPDEIKISKSMRQVIKSEKYSLTMNQCFEDVVRNCATMPRKHEEGTWIGEAIFQAYSRLHQLGFARSVEVWNREGQLVGGLYGVELNQSFFGESMFHLENNTSKLALIFLCQSMNYRVIDSQIYTKHMEGMGGRFIDFDDFLKLIEKK